MPLGPAPRRGARALRAVLGANQKAAAHVDLPSATGWVFSALHTGVGLALVGAVAGEYLGSCQGVGYLVLTAFALLLDALVGRIERHLMKWQLREAQTGNL